MTCLPLAFVVAMTINLPQISAQDAAIDVTFESAENSGVSDDTDSSEQQSLQVYSLNYADASSVEQFVSKLYPTATLAADSSSNTLYCRADEETLKEIEALAMRADDRAEKQEIERVAAEEQRQKELAAQRKGDAEYTDSAVKTAFRMLNLRMGDEQDENGMRLLKELVRRKVELKALQQRVGLRDPRLLQKQSELKEFQRIMDELSSELDILNVGRTSKIYSPEVIRLDKTYRQREQESATLASELREHRTVDSTLENNARRTELKQQLESTVIQAFDTRQELQQAEASALREQLERIESRIQRREELRDKIIVRRVKELLEEEAEDAWEVPLTTNDRSSESRSPLGRGAGIEVDVPDLIRPTRW